MKNKRILNIILSILILFMSNNGFAFAVNELSEFSEVYLERSSFNELQNLAQKASNDAEATAVFDELVRRVEGSQVSSTSLIDTYFTHYSTSTSGTSIDVYYRVKALVPSGASLSIGYEYPAITRTSGSSISLSGKSVGTYHAYFTSKGLRCYSRTYASFRAGTLSQHKAFSTYLAFPQNLGSGYRTVTSGDASIGKIALTAAGIYTLVKFERGSIASWASTITSLVTIGLIWTKVPPLATNQYIQLDTYYSGGRMYQRIRIWQNYTAFKNDFYNPLYTGTSSATLPGF